jgi:hypothetical protein
MEYYLIIDNHIRGNVHQTEESAIKEAAIIVKQYIDVKEIKIVKLKLIVK